MKSQITKSYKNKYILCTFLSWVITLAPMLVYVIIAFIQGNTANKLTLGIICIGAIVLVAVNTLLKLHMRSIMWVLLIGVYICLKNITTLLVIVALTTIVDELVLTPLAKSYKTKFTINKEFDKRAGTGNGKD